jgi:peptidyl-prolyl cis-trans isomerase A (cyclophilin A)
MIKRRALTALFILFICLNAFAQAGDAAAVKAASLTSRLPDGLYAVIDTPRGVIILELYYQKAPLAVASFVGLAEGKFQDSGKPYFDGLSFHRVEPNFVIQGGDPLGNGMGGPGYRFPNEIDPSLSFNSAGILAMANAGPDTNGSQFFITLDAAPRLNGGYTIFGRVASGMDSVRIIRKGELMTSVRIVRRGGAASAFSMDKAAFDAVILARQDKARQEARAVVDAQMTRVKARLGALSANADGSLYKILKPGNGTKAAKGSAVSVLYTLSNADGAILDSSASRNNEPISFSLGQRQVVAGFDAAVAAMSYGEKRVIVLPPELAYGSAGAGNVIPPNAVLVFELELLAP